MSPAIGAATESRPAPVRNGGLEEALVRGKVVVGMGGEPFARGASLVRIVRPRHSRCGDCANVARPATCGNVVLL